MGVIDLGGVNRLDIEPESGFRLQLGAAGARIELPFKFGRLAETAITVPFRISGELYASRLSHQNRRFVCRLDAEHLVEAGVRPNRFTMYGFIGDDQLRAIEAIRLDGGSLAFTVAFDVSAVYGEPSILSAHQTDVWFPISGGDWCAELDRVDAGAYVAFLVKMPVAEVHSTAVKRIREGRDLLRDNQVDAALVTARQALEPVLAWARQGDLSKNAQSKKRSDRSLDERLAVLVEELFSVLSGAAHDDAITKDFDFKRAEAEGLISMTAALINRLAQHG